MKINVAELIKNEFKHIVIDEKCEGFTAEEDYIIQSPVNIKGELWYESGITKVDFISTFNVSALCARCAGEFDFSDQLKIEDEFSTDDLIETYGSEIDTEVLLKDQITLNMPLKILCSPDCKGLCSICGCNLNSSKCKCNKDENINPQFAALSKWQTQGKDKDQEV